jgi:hypothetical protein
MVTKKKDLLYGYAILSRFLSISKNIKHTTSATKKKQINRNC